MPERDELLHAQNDQEFIAMQEAVTSRSLEYLGPRKAGTC